MPVKSSTVRCLLNAVVNMPRYCSGRTLNIAWSRNVQNGTFKIITKSFLLLVLNKIIKTKTRNTIKPSCRHGDIILNSMIPFRSRKSHFSIVWVVDFIIKSSCLGKIKVFPINLACQS